MTDTLTEARYLSTACPGFMPTRSQWERAQALLKELVAEVEGLMLDSVVRSDASEHHEAWAQHYKAQRDEANREAFAQNDRAQRYGDALMQIDHILATCPDGLFPEVHRAHDIAHAAVYGEKQA